MQPFSRGAYRVRLATTPEDEARALALRHRVFRKLRGLGGESDADRFDPLCQHVLVEEGATGALVGCFRSLTLADGAALGQSYSGQVYDLSPMRGMAGPMIEMGRFCVAPDRLDPDILRLAWGAVTRLVDGAGAAVLLGCTSFTGADPARHAAALALLHSAHVGPAALRPLRKPGQVQVTLTGQGADARAGLAALPPLLRTYLGMGGWVSDHAVIDRDLDTLHVFTAVEIAKIPAARARALRAIAAD